VIFLSEQIYTISPKKEGVYTYIYIMNVNFFPDSDLRK